MSKQIKNHQGFEIVIESEEGGIESLSIAGKSIDISKTDTGNYITSMMPYTQYDSVLELAKHVVEKTPDFDTISGEGKRID